MARSQESYSKKEREKKKQKRKKEKAEQREQRKAEKAESGGTSFDDMIMYVDEFGNFHETPPEPAKKVKAENIVLGIPPKDDTPVDTTRRGRVKFFNDEKGYGFIVDVDNRESIFVHINNVFNNTPLQENERVTFEVEMGPKGPNAVNVNPVD